MPQPVRSVAGSLSWQGTRIEKGPVGTKSSIAFGVAGIILVVIEIVWWAAIAPLLVKLPSDLKTPMDFERAFTYSVDPTTKQPLPAGQELKVPSRRPGPSLRSPTSTPPSLSAATPWS
jgi:hypothetical protein